MKPELFDDPRRQFLIKALAAGLYAVGGLRTAAADVLGKVPRQLANDKSFYRIEGEVSVNGQPANENTLVTSNDQLQTGANSQAIFAVGQDAFFAAGK